jgi:hypothetical protein
VGDPVAAGRAAGDEEATDALGQEVAIRELVVAARRRQDQDA